ncbi:MAG: site-specific integrase, partial [Thermodesulfovibrionales bacterium]
FLKDIKKANKRGLTSWVSLLSANYSGYILLDRTKNGERREIPMNAEVRALFTELLKNRVVGIDYVFVNPQTGKRLTDIKRSFSSACRRAGIQDLRFHDLRHTFASHLVMAGVDLRTVQELMGHKSITMTLRYSHLAKAHKEREINRVTITKYYNFITIWGKPEAKGSQNHT